MPEFVIKEWSNHDYESLFCGVRFCREAFNLKKWAFVSDYIRLYALYNYGGVYFDTDVELSRSLDIFLENDFFSCFEIYGKNVFPVMTAVMGAVPKSEMVGDLLSEYQERGFLVGAAPDLMPNTEHFARYLVVKKWLLPPYNPRETRSIPGGIIYPSGFFCRPIEGFPSYAIHHFDGTWQEDYSIRVKVKLFQYKLLKVRKNKREAPLFVLKERYYLIFHSLSLVGMC